VFWLQRLKQEEQDAAWAISYGDMMSLLMAVFVMIAAMSELRSGGRFETVRDAVWGAFGFSDARPTPGNSHWERPRTLSEQLARAGLLNPAAGKEAAPQEVALRCCDVSHEADRLVIRIAGPAAFERGSAALRQPAVAAVERLAALLRPGRARIEVRGHNGDGRIAPSSFFRDGLDLSYQRARGVVNALVRAGVDADRLYVSACGDQEPLTAVTPAGLPTPANRRIEIVVHAVRAGGADRDFAEKGQQANGQ
jgi:chemotaxis protein MotB